MEYRAQRTKTNWWSNQQNWKKKTKIEIDDIQGLGPDAQRISQEVREVIEKIERRKKDEKIKLLKKQNAELRKILKEKNEIIISLSGNKNIIKKSVINIKKWY